MDQYGKSTSPSTRAKTWRGKKKGLRAAFAKQTLFVRYAQAREADACWTFECQQSELLFNAVHKWQDRQQVNHLTLLVLSLKKDENVFFLYLLY